MISVARACSDGIGCPRVLEVGRTSNAANTASGGRRADAVYIRPVSLGVIRGSTGEALGWNKAGS